MHRDLQRERRRQRSARSLAAATTSFGPPRTVTLAADARKCQLNLGRFSAGRSLTYANMLPTYSEFRRQTFSSRLPRRHRQCTGTSLEKPMQPSPQQSFHDDGSGQKTLNPVKSSQGAHIARATLPSALAMRMAPLLDSSVARATFASMQERQGVNS